MGRTNYQGQITKASLLGVALFPFYHVIFQMTFDVSCVTIVKMKKDRNGEGMQEMLHNISADASLIRCRIYCRNIEHTKMAVGLSAIIFIFMLFLSMTISQTAALDPVENKYV